MQKLRALYVALYPLGTRHNFARLSPEVTSETPLVASRLCWNWLLKGQTSLSPPEPPTPTPTPSKKREKFRTPRQTKFRAEHDNLKQTNVSTTIIMILVFLLFFFFFFSSQLLRDWSPCEWLVQCAELGLLLAFFTATRPLELCEIPRLRRPATILILAGFVRGHHLKTFLHCVKKKKKKKKDS